MIFLCYNLSLETAKGCNEIMKKSKVYCNKCYKANPMVAKYCAGCGIELDPALGKAAYKKSGYKVLEIIDKIISIFNLSFITENKWFRIIFLTVLILVGVVFKLIGLNQFGIKASKNYDVVYDKSIDRYIVSCDTSEDMDLKLKVPHDTQTLVITTYTKQGDEVCSEEVELAKTINFQDITNSYYDISVGERTIQVEFSYRNN